MPAPELLIHTIDKYLTPYSDPFGLGIRLQRILWLPGMLACGAKSFLVCFLLGKPGSGKCDGTESHHPHTVPRLQKHLKIGLGQVFECLGCFVDGKTIFLLK